MKPYFDIGMEFNFFWYLIQVKDHKEVFTVEALMDDALSLGESVAADGDNHAAVAPKREKQPHEIATIHTSIGRNAMLSGLDSDARASLTSCMRERKFGRIVNIASRALLGKTHRTAYSGSKGGIAVVLGPLFAFFEGLHSETRVKLISK